MEQQRVSGIEEQFAQMGVNVQKQQMDDQGFMVISSPSTGVPVSMMTGVPASGGPVMGPGGGEFANRVVSDDERSDHGGRKQQQQQMGQPMMVMNSQPQQKHASGGGGDLPSPDSVSRNAEFMHELKRNWRDKRKQLGDLDNKPKPSYERVVKDQIECALDYYKNEMKGGDYEFVKCEKMVPPSLLVAHTNFYARLKGIDSSPEFFFAELQNGTPQKTTHCCKLDPRFHSVDGSGTLNPFQVLHCEHVKCTGCAKWSDVVIGPGEGVCI